MKQPLPEVIEASLDRAEHAAAVVRLLDAYAQDPMGDGQPLSMVARQNLIAGLRAHPTALVFLAYDAGEPVGLAICFRGFSTFAARPLVNVSDYYVVPAARGRGVGRRLLEFVERRARELGCCRMTLEVQEHNERAQKVYTSAGFIPTVHVPAAGAARFLSKELTESAATRPIAEPPISSPDSSGEIEYRTIDYGVETELRSYLRLLWEIPRTQNEYFTCFSEAFLEDWMKSAKATETEANTFSGVALYHGEIVGLHVVRRYEEYQQVGAHIAGLWVRPGYERRGIARTLKTQGEAWARSIGAVFINTNVHAGNKRMLEINQNAGFKIFRHNLRKRL